MTITRLWQAGAELQHVDELDQSPAYEGGSLTISSTKARTGTYSFRGSVGQGKAIDGGTTQIRAGLYLNHNDLGAKSSSWKPVIYYVKSSSDILVQWNGATDNLELLVGGVLQDSAPSSTAGFSTIDTWLHCGITCKADASTGFVSFYVDGTQVLTYSGNTGTSITGVYFSGDNSIGGFATYAYWDDFYLDDTVGEADGPVPSPRFSFLLPNGAGTHTNMTPNTGANYAAVDDSGAPDDDTTYVYATSASVKDSYALTNTTPSVTVPAGYNVIAVIAAAWARKTDAGVATTLQIGTRLSASETIGSAQTLATDYGPLFERQTTKPGGGAWSESDIDSAEVILQSAGAYA